MAEKDDDAKDRDVVVGDEISSTSSRGVDYLRLVVQFGTQLIDAEQLERLRRLSAKQQRLHTFLRRDLFFSHRDLGPLLDDLEKGRPFYLYTGRGPSAGSLHLGHLVPFMFTRYLQEAFGAFVVIQITDDEKVFSRRLSLEECRAQALENVRDIVSLGFDPERTFIFCNSEYMGTMYPLVIRVLSLLTNSTVAATLGVEPSDCIGRTVFPAVEAAPAFPSAFPALFPRALPGDHSAATPRCLVVSGIDQDPYFRLARDVSARLGFDKPSIVHGKFLPSLLGLQNKMDSSKPGGAIFLSDSDKDIANKVNRFAFSGGQATKELQQKLGADLAIDVSVQYLRFFLQDDEELARIEGEYAAGRMMTSQVKKVLIQVLQTMLGEIRARRVAVTDELVRRFMSAAK